MGADCLDHSEKFVHGKSQAGTSGVGFWTTVVEVADGPAPIGSHLDSHTLFPSFQRRSRGGLAPADPDGDGSAGHFLAMGQGTL
jgi:hypothetical protein